MIAEVFGIPVKNYLTEKGPDGKDRALPGEKFYIPGSLLKTNIDNTNPLAYGMNSTVDVFFDNSPVFRLEPTAEMKKTNAVGWFSGCGAVVERLGVGSAVSRRRNDDRRGGGGRREGRAAGAGGEF